MSMSITEALSAVMNHVQAVAKNDRNTHQNFDFRGIDAVVNAVGPALRKHGVVVVPEVQDVAYEKVTTTNNKPATACRLVVSYTFHKDDSYLSCTVAAEAWDHGDKAAPKAMSVAFRTALLQALALPTDEPDPDAQTFEQAKPSKPEPTSPKRLIMDRLKQDGINPETFVSWLEDNHEVTRLDDLDDDARMAVVKQVTSGALSRTLKGAA